MHGHMNIKSITWYLPVHANCALSCLL